MNALLRRLLPAATVVLLALVVYANSLPGAFILDDVLIVRDNPLVSEPDLRGIFSSDYWGTRAGSGLYRPLTILSYAANRALFGAGALSFHLINILLHAAASLSLYLLLRRLPLAPGVAWLAAALFAVHPIHGEAVNTVVGRAELLVAVFTILGLLTALGRGRGHRPLAALWYALALFAKESAPAFVLLLACIDTFTAGNLRDLLHKRRRLYALLAAVTLAWFAVRTWALGQSAMPPDVFYATDNPVVGLSTLPRLLTAAWIQLLYLRNLVFPHPLLGVYTTNYIGRVETLLSLQAAAAIAATVAMAFLGVRGWRRRSGYGLGMAFYFAAFFVNLNVIFLTFIAVADRLAYLPSAGFCLAAASLLLMAAGPASPRPLLLAARAAGIGYLALLAGFTIARNPEFSSSLRLWQHTVEADPGNSRAWLYLGDDLAKAGRMGEAEAAYRRAINADRSFPDAHVFFSSFLLDAGRAEEALQHAEEAMRLVSGGFGPVTLVAARANLRLGRPREALVHLDGVHQYYATTPAYQEIRAKTLDALGDASGAMELYRKVASLPGGSPAISLRLAELLIEAGQAREAEAVLRARMGTAGSADLHNLLGVSLALQSRLEEAMREFESALERDPASVLFRDNLENARKQSAARAKGR